MSPHITSRPRKRTERGSSKRSSKKKKDEDQDAEIEITPPSSTTVKFSFPIPEKGTANIFIPRDIEQEDWEMISTMMTAYIGRLGKK